MSKVRGFSVTYFALAALISGLVLTTGAYIEFEIWLLKAIFSVGAVFVLLLGASIFGAYDVRTLFNLTYVFFMFGSVIVSLFLPVELRDVESITTTAFDLDNFAESILLSAFPLFIINLGFVLFSNLRKCGFRRRNPRFDEKLYTIGSTLFWIALPAVVWKGVMVARFAWANGYVAFYSTDLADIVAYPEIVRLASNLFYFGFYLILCVVPAPDKIKKFLVIFFLVSVIDSLKGNRGMIFLIPLFSIWYFGFFYGVKLKFKKIFKIGFIFILLIFGANTLLVHRGDVADEAKATMSVFVLSASTSNRVVNYYLEYRDDLPETNIPYIFEPLVFPFSYLMHREELSQGQSEEVIRIRENLNHRLTYHLNRDYYLTGGGLGSSFILEMYEFGVPGLVFFSLIFTILVNKYMRAMLHSRFANFLSFLIITHILMMPRAEYLPGIWSIGKYACLYLIVVFLARRIMMSPQARGTRLYS
jgi:oligosaccharide repeat unit polymerase